MWWFRDDDCGWLDDLGDSLPPPGRCGAGVPSPGGWPMDAAEALPGLGALAARGDGRFRVPLPHLPQWPTMDAGTSAARRSVARRGGPSRWCGHGRCGHGDGPWGRCRCGRCGGGGARTGGTAGRRRGRTGEGTGRLRPPFGWLWCDAQPADRSLAASRGPGVLALARGPGPPTPGSGRHAHGPRLLELQGHTNGHSSWRPGAAPPSVGAPAMLRHGVLGHNGTDDSSPPCGW